MGWARVVPVKCKVLGSSILTERALWGVTFIRRDTKYDRTNKKKKGDSFCKSAFGRGGRKKKKKNQRT